MRRTSTDLEIELNPNIMTDIDWPETESTMDISCAEVSVLRQENTIPVLSLEKTIMMLERQIVHSKARSIEISTLNLLMDLASKISRPDGRICIPKQNIVISKDLKGEIHFPGEEPLRNTPGCPLHSNAQAIGICMKCVAGNLQREVIVV